MRVKKLIEELLKLQKTKGDIELNLPKNSLLTWTYGTNTVAERVYTEEQLQKEWEAELQELMGAKKEPATRH